MSERKEKTGWYSRTELVSIYVLSTTLLIGLVVTFGMRRGWFSPTPEIIKADPSEFDYRIDLNTAHWTELQLLPDIGEVRAKSIVAYREEHGAFREPDDLLSVPGISSAIVERIRKHVVAGDGRADSQEGN